MKGAGPNRAFWNRDFALALVGYLFLFLSITLFYLFPLFLDRFHPTKSRVGLIMGVHNLTAILVRPFFGRLIDERGGRTIALGGILFLALVLPWFHLIAGAGILPLALRALTGAGWGISMTAALALCSDLAPQDRMAHSLGIIGLAGIVASAVGPMLAEEIVRHAGYGGVFNAALALQVAAFGCMLATREAPRPHFGAARSALFDSGTYPLAILAIIAAMPIVHGAVRGAIVNFIALFGSSAGFGRIGPFFAVFSAAAVLTRLGIGDVSDRYGRKQVILPAALLISLNLFWIAGVESYGVFMLNGFIAGLGQGLIYPALCTYMIDFLGRANKGYALGLYSALFDAGMGLGSPFFGWISDLVGYRRMYAAAGALLLLSTVVFSAYAPRTETGSGSASVAERGHF